MTPQDVATFIVSRWRLGHTTEAIMVALVMQRVPMKKQDILTVIRRYCDTCTENTTYRPQKRIGRA